MRKFVKKIVQKHLLITMKFGTQKFIPELKMNASWFPLNVKCIPWPMES